MDTMEADNLTTMSLDGELSGGGGDVLYGEKSPVLLASYYIACILGMPGNIMTVTVILSSKKLRSKPINRILIHQAVIDALVLVATGIEEVMDEVANDYIMTLPFVCHYVKSKMLSAITMYASTYNMLVLSVERYSAIIDPLKYDAEKLLKRLPFYFAGVWCLCIAFMSIVPATTVIQFGMCLNAWKLLTTRWWEFYSPYDMVIAIVIPFIVTIFCYSRMFYALQKSSDATNMEKSSNDANAHKMRMAQMNIFKTCFTMVVIFVVCWSIPQSAVLLLSIRYYKTLNNYHFYIGRLAVTVNSCLNPYIYSIRYDEFKMQLFTLLGRTT